MQELGIIGFFEFFAQLVPLTVKYELFPLVLGTFISHAQGKYFAKLAITTTSRQKRVRDPTMTGLSHHTMRDLLQHIK